MSGSPEMPTQMIFFLILSAWYKFVKGVLSPVMLKQIFQFENFEIYKDLYGKPLKPDRVTKVVFLMHTSFQFSTAVAISTFEILHKRLKIFRLLNFNILFQLVLTKFFKSKLSSCLLKVDHMIKLD